MIYFIGNIAIHESPHYQLATIDDVVDYCSTKTILGVDTETEGLDFTCKKMIMFQIGDEENQFVDIFVEDILLTTVVLPHEWM